MPTVSRIFNPFHAPNRPEEESMPERATFPPPGGEDSSRIGDDWVHQATAYLWPRTSAPPLITFVAGSNSTIVGLQPFPQSRPTATL